jgi:acid phosphatase (class A)
MIIRTGVIPAAAAVLAFAGAAAAQHVATSGGDASRPAETSAAASRGYLPEAQRPDVAAIVPAPPQPGTETWIEDGQTFHATRALKDGPRWKQAQYDNSYRIDDVLKGFACAVGADLSTSKTPATARLVGRGVLDAVEGSRAAKLTYRRQRPFVPTDAPICVAREQSLIDSFSYPSGHATTGWMYALLLADLAPDRTPQILNRGRAYGESRVVCGVHWKTDIEAGRDAATSAFVVLQSNPEFRADIEAARTEIAAARRAGGPKSCAADPDQDRTPLP